MFLCLCVRVEADWKAQNTELICFMNVSLFIMCIIYVICMFRTIWDISLFWLRILCFHWNPWLLCLCTQMFIKNVYKHITAKLWNYFGNNYIICHKSFHFFPKNGTTFKSFAYVNLWFVFYGDKCLCYGISQIISIHVHIASQLNGKYLRFFHWENILFLLMRLKLLSWYLVVLEPCCLSTLFSRYLVIQIIFTCRKFDASLQGEQMEIWNRKYE